ncbi:18509_t:CDS:2, partial [Funneliformis geosporum]
LVKMKNFGKYYDLYLETNVLLLADVFMNYTIMCLKDDSLDPSHYVSASEMFNDFLYKSSKAELKLIINMNENDNGKSSIYQKNNSQYPDHESSKPNFWIMYEDMNALYSGAMTQYIPTEILGKVNPEEVPDI